MDKLSFSRVVFSSLLLMTSASGVHATLYSLTDLHISGTAYGLNDLGQVVGGVDVAADLRTHAFVWSAADGFQDLGTLNGANSIAYAINNHGQVVGNNGSSAFIWNGSGSVQAIPGLSQGRDINQSGQVAEFRKVGNDVHALLWSAAQGVQDFGAVGLNGYSYALALNDQAQAVGIADTLGNGYDHAVLWSQSDGLQSLGSLRSSPVQGFNSDAEDINNLGQVVGHSQTDSFNAHAIRWTQTDGMQDLGTLGGRESRALAINDSGWIVGESFFTEETDEVFPDINHGFLWTHALGMQDLNSLLSGAPNWTVISAVDINSKGQIAANAYNHEMGEYRAVLLTPLAAARVPEPWTMGLLGMGWLLMQLRFGTARRRG